MTGKRPARRRRDGGKGLLLVVALVLTAGLIRYADTPLVMAAQEKAAGALAGAPGVDQVLAVFGGGTAAQGQAESTAYAASSGGADDILGREKTLFPDTVDETVYPMPFAHVRPATGDLTSGFGSRLSPTTGQPAFHYGVDIAADEGDPIAAFADGTVREVGQSDYGNYLIVDHDGGFSTLYAHCSSISAAVGDQVRCGEEIARAGQTGNATGPHLHLELWKDGAALDPAGYLAGL